MGCIPVSNAKGFNRTKPKEPPAELGAFIRQRLHTKCGTFVVDKIGIHSEEKEEYPTGYYRAIWNVSAGNMAEEGARSLHCVPRAL